MVQEGRGPNILTEHWPPSLEIVLVELVTPTDMPLAKGFPLSISPREEEKKIKANDAIPIFVATWKRGTSLRRINRVRLEPARICFSWRLPATRRILRKHSIQIPYIKGFCRLGWHPIPQLCTDGKQPFEALQP